MEASEFKPILNSQYYWEPLTDGCLIYDPTTSKILCLNSLSELILTFCDGQTTLAQIYEHIAQEMEFEEGEFNAAIGKLVEANVLLPAPAQP